MGRPMRSGWNAFGPGSVVEAVSLSMRASISRPRVRRRASRFVACCRQVQAAPSGRDVRPSRHGDAEAHDRPDGLRFGAEEVASMRALVFHGPGDKSWDDVPDPKLVEDTDAIVKIDTATICGTDL